MAGNGSLLKREKIYCFKRVGRIFQKLKKKGMDQNQVGRRNLTLDQFQISIGRRYNREKKKVSNQYGSNQHTKEVEGKSFPQPTTAEKLANENNISDRTVKNYAKKG